MKLPKEILENLTQDKIWVDPKTAAVWLAKIGKQRPFSGALARKYAAAMERGEWKHFSGENIIFSSDDELLDGQHRLQAQMFANKTVGYTVAYGVDPESFSIMDSGRKRSTYDALSIADWPHPHLYGQIISNSIKFQRRIFLSKGKSNQYPTIAEVMDEGEAHKKKYAESVNYTIQTKKERQHFMSASMFGTCYHVFKEINKPDAHVFFNGLLFPTDKTGNQIKLLRGEIIQIHTSEFHMPHKHLYNRIFTTWNHWREKRALTTYANLNGEMIYMLK